MGRVITAGVDGSRYSRTALQAAVHTARERDAALRIVHVRRPEHAIGDTPERRFSRMVLDDAYSFARELASGMRVERRSVAGEPATGLLATACGSDLLVVGTRGSSRISPSLLGSTASALAAQTGLPIEVVGHAPEHRHRRVVLGLSAARPDAAVIRFAFEAAARTDSRLAIVYSDARNAPLVPAPGAGSGSGVGVGAGAGAGPSQSQRRSQCREQQEATLNHIARVWGALYPQTPVTLRPVPSMGDNALVAASMGADLLVIGRAQGRTARLRGPGAPLSLLAYAACPVAIVPCPVVAPTLRDASPILGTGTGTSAEPDREPILAGRLSERKTRAAQRS